MEHFIEFCWRCLVVAFRASWDAADWIGTAIGILLAFVAVFYPQHEQPAGKLAAKVIVLAVLMLFLLRLFSAPYFVYLESERTEAALRKQIKEQQKTIDERQKRKELQDTFGRFLTEAQVLMTRCQKNKIADPQCESDAAEWLGRLQAFIRQELGESYVARLEDPSGIFEMTMHNTPEERQPLANGIMRRRVRVLEFMKELATRP